MALLDREELLKIREQFKLKTSTIGTLRVCPLSYNGLQKLAANYGYLKNVAPIKVVRYLITNVAYLNNPEKKEISLDDKKISITDSEKLSEADLNKFAEKFIKYNEEYLLKKLDISGTETSYSMADIHREENEPSINYLSKLIINKINDYIREEEALVKSFGISDPANLFPNHLTLGILNTLESERRLFESILPFQKEIDNIQKYSNWMRGLEHHEPSLPTQERFNFEHIKIERPTDRIRETNEKLDLLIDYQAKMGPVIEESSRLLAEMNNLWIKFAGDSKIDSNTTIRYNRLIIAITIISLLLTGVFSFLNYQSSIETSKISEKYMSLLIDENRKINNSVNLYQNNLNKIIDNQSRTIDIINNKKSIKAKNR